MARPDLAAALFGLPEHPSETQKRFAAATASLILTDLITQCAKHASREGPGALVIAIGPDSERNTWASPKQLKANLAIAEQLGDTAMVDVHQRVLERLGSIDPTTTALVLRLESDGGSAKASLFELDLDRDPDAAAACVRELG